MTKPSPPFLTEVKEHMEERIHTGIKRLDSLVGGGFFRSSLILLAGNPGTGKTIFANHFIYNGAAESGEKGVYVSFSEGHKQLIEYASTLGFDFKELEEKGMVRILDMVAAKEEGVSAILEFILGEVEALGARRLVIDSFSAMAQSFAEKIDARIVLNLILNKIVRRLGCTTLVIVEIPVGNLGIGLGLEEFVADAVLILKRRLGLEVDGRLMREVGIVKMRGTSLEQLIYLFTLHEGFRVFPPFRAEPIQKTECFKPMPDPPGKFSTGSQELDRLLDGGYPKGSTVLLEVGEDVSLSQYSLIMWPTVWDSLAKGRGYISIPSSGVDYHIVKEQLMEVGFTEDEINHLTRVFVSRFSVAPKEPYIVKLEGENTEENYREFLKVEEELMNETGLPVVRFTGADTLTTVFGREVVERMLNVDATRIREKGNLGINIIKPGHAHLVPIAGAIADVHLKMAIQHGVLLLYGVKPSTGLHAVEMDVSRGYPLPKLTPII